MLGLLLDRQPDVFQKLVLPLLDPTDRALLARVSHACREAERASLNDASLSVSGGFCTSVELQLGSVYRRGFTNTAVVTARGSIPRRIQPTSDTARWGGEG